MPQELCFVIAGMQVSSWLAGLAIAAKLVSLASVQPALLLCVEELYAG